MNAQQQNPTDDWYAVLQVSLHAEFEVIDAAYKRLARKYHPDQNRDSNAAEQMRMLNRAYEILSDPAKREVYDRERSSAASHAAERSATRRDNADDVQSVGGQTRRAVHRLWITCAVVVGSIGPVAAVFILAEMPSAPEWTGTVSVISRKTGEMFELSAEEAQVRFLSGEVGLHPDETVEVTTNDGDHFPCRTARAYEALTTERWHFSTLQERERTIGQRASNYWIAVGWACGLPLVCYALFKWGLWLFASR